MQTFISTTSTKNNICFSKVSQKEAELKAKKLDDNNCYNCYDCYNCYNCDHCKYCNHCNNCHNCTYCNCCDDCYHCKYCDSCNNCSHCNYCNYCNHCNHCHHCHQCHRCNHCNHCNDCSGYVIQAGYHNGYWCYGSLKGNILSIQCGCRVKSYAGAIEYWSNKPHRREILAACEFIATVARQLNWNL